MSKPRPCYGKLRYLRWEMVRTTRRPSHPTVPRREVINLTCREGIYSDEGWL